VFDAIGCCRMLLAIASTNDRSHQTEIIMNDDTSKKKGGRVALSKNQASEGLGRELVELSSKWLADGKFDSNELEELTAWLAKVPVDSLPAIRFLKEEVERFISAGEISEWELSRLQNAVIRVIPQRERQEAKSARAEFDRVNSEIRAREREKNRQEKDEYWRGLRKQYASDWENESASDAQLDFIRDLGGKVSSEISKLEAAELIDDLLNKNAPAANIKSGSGCFSVMVVFLIVATGFLYSLGKLDPI
jgi:hypothetical protein